MQIADRLKPHFFTIAVAVGCAAAWVLSPLDWFDGFILFLLGSVAGDWNRRLNPVTEQAEGPIIAWTDMDTGDKLAYFFPSLVISAFGLVFLVVSIQFSRVSVDWISICLAIFVIIMGIGQGYWKWLQRHRSLDVS